MMNLFKEQNKSKILKLVIISFIVIFIDQLTKYIVVKTILLYKPISVIPGFFNLTHLLNPGGAFGFLSGQSETLRSIVFIFLSCLAVIMILYYYMTTPFGFPWILSALALIFGGAIGNIIDRIRFREVVDFLDFYIGNLHWPAFNIADSAITIGVGIFIIHILFKKLPD